MIRIQDEQIVVPFLIKLLKTGKYCSTQIINNFHKDPVSSGYKYNLGDSRIREIVNYIRKNKMAPILSDRCGYWISYDIAEIYECYNELMGRLDSMRDAAEGLKKQMVKINKNNNK